MSRKRLPRSTPSERASPDMRERILMESLTLVAQSGIDGVSMRDIAAVVGLTPAAIYYHFSDKEALYLAMVSYTFNREIMQALADLALNDDPWQRLETFVRNFAELLARNSHLQRIMQWVLLDTNPQRVQQLAEGVFNPVYQAVSDLLSAIHPGTDVHRHVVSVFSLLVFPFESLMVCRLMPGFRSPKEDPQALAEHILSLLRNGLNSTAQ